jgi:rhamnosyltransferase
MNQLIVERLMDDILSLDSKLNDVAVIVVFYNPTAEQMQKWLSVQHPHVIIVDNSSTCSLQSTVLPNVTYMWMKDNAGIAAAQNAGLLEARAKGYKFVAFVDQDSDVKASVLSLLKDVFCELNRDEWSIAAIGPIPVDKRTGLRLENRSKIARINSNVSEVMNLPSSGTLSPVAIFDSIGAFEEGLFIDVVDHEWCWRARSKGYKILQCNHAEFEHMIGKGMHSFLGFTFLLPAPFRLYYQYRNFISMLPRQYVPLKYKCLTGVRHCVWAVLYPLFFRPRLDYMKYIMKGVLHGLTGKSGPLKE